MDGPSLAPNLLSLRRFGERDRSPAEVSPEGLDAGRGLLIGEPVPSLDDAALLEEDRSFRLLLDLSRGRTGAEGFTTVETGRFRMDSCWAFRGCGEVATGLGLTFLRCRGERVGDGIESMGSGSLSSPGAVDAT